jgi:beta-lactamase regulating signal transducer with metallopeptidase domain
MNSLICLAASYLVNSVWGVAAIGGAGWVVSRLLKRLGPHVQHVAWVTTLGLAVIAPVLPLCRSLLRLIYLPGAPDNYPSVVFIAAQTGRSTGSGSILLPSFLIQVLAVFYLSTLLYFAMRLGWLLHRTIRFVREGKSVSLEPESNELWNRSKRVFSVENALILNSKRISGPVTVGLVRPLLLVPEGFIKECTSHDFLAALAHECAHMKRRDFQKNLAYEIATLFIDFHPVT